MKRFLYITIAALAFVACARVMVPEQEPEVGKEEMEEVVPMVKVSFKAVIEQDDATKALVDMGTGEGSWETDDEIAVHTTKGALVTLTAESAGASVTFTGSIPEGDSFPDDAVAYYPASIAVAGQAAKVNLPDSYASAANAERGFLLRGVRSGGTLTFKHIGALLKVSINDVPSTVTSLVFSTGVAVTGQLSVDASDADAPVCGIGSGATSITIASSSAERTDPVSVFYIPLPTGTLTGGFSIALKEDATTVSTKTTTKDFAIDRAKVVKMKAYAPEGEGSDWYLAGGFNSWSTSATRMTNVLGHDNWVVARNIDTTPADGQAAGFKFFNSGTWKGGSTPGLHTQYDTDNDNNINPANAQYDIYFNTSNKKFFYANAGEPWYRTIYMMTDMVLTDQTYKLLVWGHNSGPAITEGDGAEGTEEMISGIKYYKFNVGINNSPAGSYDCAFRSSTNDVRYYFYSGNLVLNDVDSHYYLRFTSSIYNGDNGDTNDNSLTQVSDPAQPQGNSNWYLLRYADNTSTSSSLSYNRMEWDNGPILVYKHVVVNSSTGLTFRFTNGSANTFYYYSGAITPGTEYTLVFNKGIERKDVPMTTVSGLSGDTYCDVYLDPINGKVRVVTSPLVKLYFRIIDREVATPHLYSFGPELHGSFPGKPMTAVKINGVDCFSIDAPEEGIWDSGVDLIVNSGSNAWQTADFTTADWSGRQEAYYFTVAANRITQSTSSDISYTYSSGFDGVNWNDSVWQTSDASGYIVAWKTAYDASNVYYYFLLNASQNSASSYIYSAYDTDRRSDTGNTANDFSGGFEAQSCYYPFKEEGGEIVCRDGVEGSSWIQSPVVTNTYSGQYHPVVHGVIKSDYDHVEMCIPKAAIGSPASTTIDVNHSWQHNRAGQRTITISGSD